MIKVENEVAIKVAKLVRSLQVISKNLSGNSKIEHFFL
jgi:hypothetical protein